VMVPLPCIGSLLESDQTNDSSMSLAYHTQPDHCELVNALECGIYHELDAHCEKKQGMVLGSCKYEHPGQR
jgi:hypothetical protein